MQYLPLFQRIPAVYTMGKVGSSSISRSIAEAGRGCIDIHTLDRTRLLRQARRQIEADTLINPHVATAMVWLRRGVREPERCTYITAVRDPVERNLSAYFQNLDFQSADQGAVTRQFDHFIESYPHDVPVYWFDSEFKRFLGIDVLTRPFDKQRRVYREDQQLLVLRLDAAPGTMEAELSAVLGTRVRMRQANIGADKGYAELYRAVKKIARYDSAHLDALYDTPFARAFWTDEELEDLRRRWLAR